MPMTQERHDIIEKSAHAMAEQLPEEERPAFVRDFVAVMTALNQRIEDRLDLFVEEVTPIVAAHLPGSPGSVDAQVTQYLGVLRELTNALMTAIGGVGNTAIRVMMVEATRDTFGFCAEALTEKDVRAEARAGVPLD